MHMDRDRLQDVLTEARVLEGLQDLVLANQIASWAEHLPPKLTSERVSSLVDTFKSNYPHRPSAF